MTQDKPMSPKPAHEAVDHIDYAFVQAKMDEAHRMRAQAMRSTFKALIELFRSPQSANEPAAKPNIVARPVEG